MKIALSSIATMAAMAATIPRSTTAQRRGSGGAAPSLARQNQNQEGLGEETVAPDLDMEDVTEDANNAAARDLLVERSDRKQFFVQGIDGCAGTLVAPDVVLASASCKDQFFGPNAPKSVIVGSTRLGELTEGSQRLGIVANSAVIHPDWNPQTLNANLMVFMIHATLTNDFIQLISRDDATLEQDVQTYGFGRVTPTGGFASKDLLCVDLVPARMLSSDCKDWVVGANRSADGVSCAYAVADYDLSDACQASTGAPVVDTSGKLVGVTSWDDGCAKESGDWEMGTSMAYTSVLDFGPWIQKAICDLSNSNMYCRGLTDGTLCGLGTTCNQCAKPATYWYSKAMTACGTEPCWQYRTVCGAGSTCNQCCKGYSWKLADFFTSCD